MKPKEKVMNSKKVIFLVLIIIPVVFLLGAIWYYRYRDQSKVVLDSAVPVSTQVNTPRVFKVETPQGFYQDDSISNVSIFAENKWKGQLVHNPVIQIKQYPGVPVEYKGDDTLAAFIRSVSDPNSTAGTALPKDCSQYLKTLSALLSNSERAKIVDQTVKNEGTDCWFYGVEKVEKMSSVDGFNAVKFSTANTSTGADNVAVQVVSGGSTYLVVISVVSTGLSDALTDNAQKAAMTEIMKNITFVK